MFGVEKIPQRLKPAVRGLFIAAVNRCATQIHYLNPKSLHRYKQIELRSECETLVGILRLRKALS
jgi:hypothetical protein